MSMGIMPILHLYLTQLCSKQQHRHRHSPPGGTRLAHIGDRTHIRWLSGAFGVGALGLFTTFLGTDAIAQSTSPGSFATQNYRERFIQQWPVEFQDDLRALVNNADSGDQSKSQVRPPLETEAENLEALIQQDLVVTDQTTSATSFTLPSLWWIHQSLTARFDGDRESAPTQDNAPNIDNRDANEAPPLPPVIDTWIAYRGSAQEPRRVDLVINNRIWNQLSYLERYTLVQQFGTSTQEFGYNLRVFSGDQPVSFYVCDFNLAPSSTALSSAQDLPRAENLEVPCLIVLSPVGRGVISETTELSAP